MNIKISLVLLSLLITSCDIEQVEYKYIKTERGLLSYGKGYCELGILLNNRLINIRDENDNPMQCSGYIMLTIQEAQRQNQIIANRTQ